MGTLLKATCKCGYIGTSMLGSSRAEHGRVFWQPCHCRTCQATNSFNMLQEPWTCRSCRQPDITPYGSKASELKSPKPPWIQRILGKFTNHSRNSPPLQSNTLSRHIDGRIQVPYQSNQCPACLNTTLQFTAEINFD